MSSPKTPMNHLDLSRTFECTTETLWQAWTTEKGLAAWWWSSWPDTTYAVDGRVGGNYQISATTHGFAVHGEYLTWEPHSLLEFTWIWTENGNDGPREHVRVTFAPTASGSLLTVTHTGPWSTPEPAENYQQGWEHVLNSLAASLSRTATHSNNLSDEDQ